MALRIGIALPHYDFSFPDGAPVTFGSVAAWAATAERLGFDSVWISDHLFLDLARYGGPDRRYASLEPMATLAGLAQLTRTIRLGTLVLCSAFRHPMMVAKEASAIDLASGGRLELGLGAGWYEAEFRAMGLEFPPAGERIAAFDEYMQILRGLLDGGAVSFSGRSYRTQDVRNEPPPARRPPMWVGSKGGPRMLRLIAERADGWNIVWRVAPDAYKRKLEDLERACATVQRDPATVRRSIGLVTVVGENASDLQQRWRRVRAWTPGGAIDEVSLEDWASDALVGRPDECIERLRAFEALGVEEVIVSFASLPFAIADAEMPALFAERILPHLR